MPKSKRGRSRQSTGSQVTNRRSTRASSRASTTTMGIQGAHTDPHLPELLELIQEQVRAALQAQQQVPAATKAVCISVTGIYVRVHVLMFLRCMYLLFICDRCFYFAIVFSSLNRVFCEIYNSAFGRDSCGGLALTPSIFTFAIVYSFSWGALQMHALPQYHV